MNSLIKSTNARYYNGALNQCKKDPKPMWKTIIQQTNKKSKTTNINGLVIDQKVITEPEEIAACIKIYRPSGKKIEIDRLSPIEVKNVILKDSAEIIADNS